MDWHACRSDLRFALATARSFGSLCMRGLEGEVCERLCGGVDQGDGRRSLRPRLIFKHRVIRVRSRLRKPVETLDAGRGQLSSGVRAATGEPVDRGSFFELLAEAARLT